LFVSHVASDDHHFRAESFQIELRVFEFFYVSGTKRESGAVSREFARHDEPEPSRTSGDQDRFVFEIVFA